MTVTFLNEAQVKAFAEATAPVVEKYTQELGADLVDMARADMAR
jgi:hypothetical protein